MCACADGIHVLEGVIQLQGHVNTTLNLCVP